MGREKCEATSSPSGQGTRRYPTILIRQLLLSFLSLEKGNAPFLNRGFEERRTMNPSVGE